MASAQANFENAQIAATRSVVLLNHFINRVIDRNRAIGSRFTDDVGSSLYGEAQFLFSDVFSTFKMVRSLAETIEKAGVTDKLESIGDISTRMQEVKQEIDSYVEKADDYSKMATESLRKRPEQAGRFFTRAYAIDRASPLARIGVGLCMARAHIVTLRDLVENHRSDVQLVSEKWSEQQLSGYLHALSKAVPGQNCESASAPPYAPAGSAKGLCVSGDEGRPLELSVSVEPLGSTKVTVSQAARVASGARDYWGNFYYREAELATKVELEHKDYPIVFNSAEYGSDIDLYMRISAVEAMKWLKSVDSSIGSSRGLTINFHNLGSAKGGDSAGVTFAVGGYSALTTNRLIPNVAMTGSIRADGKIKAVGGIHQKITGAFEAPGVEIVIVPKENESDLLFVPMDQLCRLTIIVADNVNTYLKYALEQPSAEIDRLQATSMANGPKQSTDVLPVDSLKSISFSFPSGLPREEAVSLLQQSQVALLLGDQKSAIGTLQQIAASNPEIYNAHRLLEVLGRHGHIPSGSGPILAESVPPEASPKLIIVKAVYGSAGNWKDVTESIRPLVKNNSLLVRPEQLKMQNADVSKPRTLTVTYEYAGQQDSASAQEGSELKLGQTH